MTDDRPDKSVPANLEAEEAVLGSLLIDPDAAAKIQPILNPEDFYREKNGWIYRTIMELRAAGTPADFVTVADRLEKNNILLEVGGGAYLTGLLNAVPTAVHGEHYAKIVLRCSAQRSMLDVAGSLAEVAYSESDDWQEETLAIIARARAVLANQQGGRGPQRLKVAIPAFAARLAYMRTHPGAVWGVPSGYKQLDGYLGGFHDGELTIIAARPGEGKSAFVQGVCRHAALKYGKVVALFSLEMSREDVLSRLVSVETQISGQKVRSGDLTDLEMAMVEDANAQLEKIPLYVDDARGLRVVDIEARILAMDEFPDLVVVDYVQLIKATGRASANETEQMTTISHALMELASTIKRPVIVLSQFSRAPEQRAGRRPRLSDLRGSGALEQDAHCVMFVWDPTLADNAPPGAKENESRSGVRNLLIEKQRNGPSGVMVPLYFRTDTLTFLPVDLHRTPLEVTE